MVGHGLKTLHNPSLLAVNLIFCEELVPKQCTFLGKPTKCCALKGCTQEKYLVNFHCKLKRVSPF